MRVVSKSGIDHERFGYLVKARLEALGLSFRQVSALTGVSLRQISDCCHGRPIQAGSTIMLATLCGVSPVDLYSGEARAKYERLAAFLDGEQENSFEFHAVTPVVKRETCQRAKAG